MLHGLPNLHIYSMCNAILASFGKAIAFVGSVLQRAFVSRGNGNQSNVVPYTFVSYFGHKSHCRPSFVCPCQTLSQCKRTGSYTSIIRPKEGAGALVVRREMTKIDGVAQDHTCVRRGGAILQESTAYSVAVKLDLGRVVARTVTSGRGGHAQDRD